MGDGRSPSCTLTVVAKCTRCLGAQDGLPPGRACFNFQILCRRSQPVFLWLGRQHEFARMKMKRIFSESFQVDVHRWHERLVQPPVCAVRTPGGV